MAEDIELRPNLRYALVGKTGSGKTTFAMLLSVILSPPKSGWEVWWCDSKGDGRDINALRSWGYVNPGETGNRRILYLRSANGPLSDQMDTICEKALRQGGVMIVADEYRHIVKNTRSIGQGLLDVAQRGRGLDVGLMGLTQEPVQIPRQLISQSSHIFLMDLSYKMDIKYAQEMCEQYDRPRSRGDEHGLWHSWIDGDGDWRYYKSQRDWYLRLFRHSMPPKKELVA